jgi:glycosyltransferase involved in cell wall biosynthesis
MRSIKRIAFWEPSLSPHKVELFKAIRAQDPDLTVVCVCQERLSAARQKQGWREPDTTGIEVVCSPSETEMLDVLRTSGSHTVHIFSGIRWVPCIVFGLRYAVARQLRFAIMSEPRVTEGVLGKLRILHSMLSERRLASRVEAVFAIGRHGPPWFKMVGYRPSDIVPFAYFVPPPISLPKACSSTAVRVGYVGRMVKEKGLLDLVDALRILGPDVEFEMAGSGPLVEEVLARARATGSVVRYRGVIEMGSVGEFFGNIDVLVLASTTTDDGWGVVVSEALMSGVAVVVASTVGASGVVVSNPEFGLCVPPRKPKAIAEAISTLRREGAFDLGRRESRAVKATNLLAPAAGAHVLLRALGTATKDVGAWFLPENAGFASQSRYQ